MSFIRNPFLIVCGLSLLSFSAESAGPLKPEDYEKALQIAQRKVQRERSLMQSGALSASPASRLFGRFYEEGDTWDVAVWRLQPTQMRRTSEPHHLSHPVRAPLLFRYKVIEVKTGSAARVVIQVKELNSVRADASIEFLRIELTGQLLQSRKSYKFLAHDAPVPVAPDGIRSAMTELEMLPLDFPNVLTAEQREPSALPRLPEDIAKAALEFGYQPDLSKTVWLEQDDFFGRPVQALWQHGEPWPSYLRTSHGIAILIHRGNS
ncbi:MAG: hypothetical protein A2X94_11020 [Bdellovibrionales bacterium GWB1_55_8]|nr:MAG: hypothetical protein A2X94_11020 [Bdellovibrionales bacterium GWB1_55_8]